MPSFKSGIRSSEITPESLYLSRRKFLRAGGIAAGAALLSACAPGSAPADVVPRSTATSLPASAPQAPAPATVAPIAPTGKGADGVYRDELNDPATPYDDVTGYNNFYEFTTNKEAVAELAKNLKTTPWTVTIGGLVNKPVTLDVDDIKKRFGEEERVYRLRCVEAWSMVIPWMGFPLRKLIEMVEPQSGAKYVRFRSLADKAQMPGLNDPFSSYQWPYTEGLRLDEAMHELTFMATGLYGKALPPQNGAPLRLAVPWKYGFKSIKSVVSIDLVDAQPTSLWMAAAPDEYGFYSNVNPNKSHPRWSQASERRIGEGARRRTLMFNGYEAQVAGLYKDMDLNANY